MARLCKSENPGKRNKPDQPDPPKKPEKLDRPACLKPVFAMLNQRNQRNERNQRNCLFNAFLELCNPFCPSLSSVPSEADWHYISRLARLHGVSPFFFYRTRSIPVDKVDSLPGAASLPAESSFTRETSESLPAAASLPVPHRGPHFHFCWRF